MKQFRLIIIFLFLIAHHSPFPSYAKNFTGVYGGLTSGINIFQSGASQISNNPNGLVKFNSTETFFNYGVYGGYGHLLNNYFGADT